MTRTKAKENLIAIGISEPTEQQISDYLNQVGTEIRGEKSRADGYKADAEKAGELQRTLDERETSYKSALEEAQSKIAKLEKAQALVSSRNSVMKAMGLTAEQVEKYVLEDGTYDHSYLAKLISDRESAAANAKLQEIASAQGNPGGGNTTTDTKTEAEKAAEVVGNNIVSSRKASNDILSNYI